TNLSGGIYTVNITDANGCTTSSTVEVLQSNMQITLTPVAVTCFGGNDGSVSSIVTGGLPPYSYAWNIPGQSTSGINGLTQGTYTVTITDSINCVSSNSTNVTQPLQPPVSLTANPAGICFGKSTDITAGGGITYQWSTGSTANLITVSPTQSTTYTVTITDVSGCTNSATINVPVYPLPVVSFATDTVCAGQSTSFTNTSTVASGIIAAYQWNFSTGGTSSSMNPAATFNAGTGSAQLIATTDQGCVDSVTNSLRVWNLPVADFIADTTEGCPPISVQFTDQSSSVDGAVVGWLWNSGNGNVANTASFNCDYPQSGFYDVSLQVTSSYGCVSDTVLNDYIHVYDQPVADFTTMPVQPSVYVPNVQFYDESFAAALWYWEFGDQGVSNLQNPLHTYVFPGTYEVTLYIQSAEGCKDTITKEVTVLDEVAVWLPNSFTPNNDGINDIFFAMGTNISDFSLEIYNRWGDLVFVTDNPTKGWDGTLKNEAASQDVYVYSLKYKTINNDLQTKFGRISLIR
ncbi:MAG: PKD domain-containing protein, partial [Bacteroidia bacterium]